MGRHRDNERAEPDILDCLANLSTDEVFTPPPLASQMLDLLPRHVWTDPTLKWLDPSVKTGSFLREIALRLMHSLGREIPDDNERREHIYRNMLYGFPISGLTGMMSRRSLYYSKDANHPDFSVVRMGSAAGNIPDTVMVHEFIDGACVDCGVDRAMAFDEPAYPFLHPDQIHAPIEAIKFDIIVGNPPQQVGQFGDVKTSAAFGRFIEEALKREPRYILMVVPSGWFGSPELAGLRSRLATGSHVSRIVDYPSAKECFPGTSIRGGAHYFLWDRDHNGPCSVVSVHKGEVASAVTRSLNSHGVFLRSNEAASIIDKVATQGGIGRAAHLISRPDPFGVGSGFNNFRPGLGEWAIDIQTPGVVKRTSADNVTRREAWIKAPKVFIRSAVERGGTVPAQIFTIKAHPTHLPAICTAEHLMAGPCKTREEAESLATYLETRLVRFLVSLRRSADPLSPDDFKFVPAPDLTEPWTDEKLYIKYGLTELEILCIEAQTKDKR